MIEEQKAFVKMGTKYKNTFASLEGQDVLEHIVFNILGTFRTDKSTESDMALSNAGAEILNYVACSDANITSKSIIVRVKDGMSKIVKACIDAQPITINKGENK